MNLPFNYLTGNVALNLPDIRFGQPPADWHCFGNGLLRERVQSGSMMAARAAPLWGRVGIDDVREALLALGQTAGNAASPIWGACHPRAVADMVLSGLGRCCLHRRVPVDDVHSWLWVDQQYEMLDQLVMIATERVSEADRQALLDWIGSVAMR